MPDDKEIKEFNNLSKTDANQPGNGQQDHELPDEAKNGAIILGTEHEHYYTRYCIDRAKHREFIRSKVRLKECAPCLVPRENGRTVRKYIWDIVRGEAFLITLHAVVIGLGAAKEALNYEEFDEDLHIAYSVSETVATLVVVFIRMVSARHGYKLSVAYRNKMEVWDGTEDHTAETVGRHVQAFLIVAAILSILNALALIPLIYFEDADLAWTIITNNIVLIIVGGLGGQVQGMIKGEMATLREDQHKAVIYEYALLLSEYDHADDTESRSAIRAKAARFSKALHETELLQKPEYMSCADASFESDDVTTYNTVTML